ncbi:hypothetical protein FH972_022013 [Carpinus fangiana]|uniref:GDS1 winged helix domain-containing protein n=1 Tax=Carpinus fangiana TaxID=176857 RepID=A0A5N6KRD4_9ROSI|nr:hypothetical protein FH972_022013 [Carpinus fangiana]
MEQSNPRSTCQTAIKPGQIKCVSGPNAAVPLPRVLAQQAVEALPHSHGRLAVPTCVHEHQQHRDDDDHDEAGCVMPLTCAYPLAAPRRAVIGSSISCCFYGTASAWHWRLSPRPDFQRRPHAARRLGRRWRRSRADRLKLHEERRLLKLHRKLAEERWAAPPVADASLSRHVTCEHSLLRPHAATPTNLILPRPAALPCVASSNAHLLPSPVRRLASPAESCRAYVAACLSLTSMGIHVPGSNQNRHQNRSPPSSTAATPAPASSAPGPADQQSQHPPKRVKRSHTLSSDLSHHSSTAPPPHAATSLTPQSHPAGPAAGNTPPPSPDDHTHLKIDKEGINDDVVVAVLEQLESTGNRPHLIKELAVILTNSLKVVESSANPTAIISSRLTNYLRRPWTALAPCPLAKEQVTVHPRRVYYFLATSSRQDIPEYTDAIAAIPANGRMISPSLADGPDEEIHFTEEFVAPPIPATDTDYRRDREAMSPSPDLDDFDLPSHYIANPADIEPYNARGRVQSPPLELDEREFSATACSMQALKRKQSEEAERQQSLQRQDTMSASQSSSGASDGSGSPMEDTQASAGAGEFTAASTMATDAFPTLAYSDETEESAALANREAAAALFGQSANAHAGHLGISDAAGMPAHFSSPMLRPLSGKLENLPPSSLASSTPRKTPAFGPSVGNDVDVSMIDASLAWEMRNPEAIGLNELDDLLGGF